MAEENAMDPIHQFVIKPIVSLHPFGIDASFTNASLFMMIVVLSAAALMLLGTQSRALVPSRLQSLAEMAYQFVASTVHMAGGHDGCLLYTSSRKPPKRPLRRHGGLPKKTALAISPSKRKPRAMLPAS